MKPEVAFCHEDSEQPQEEELSAPASALEGAAIRSLHHRLTRLMATRQRLEADLAERLRHVSGSRDYHFVHGFPSMEAYAQERHGLSPRRLYYLMALGRTLERLPALRRAFVTGRLTMKQALLVGSIATVLTERAWIERARSVTLLRLEDEASFWNHLKEVRPEVWERLDGAPLPKGLTLAPGLPPRLHASASSVEGSGLTAEAFIKLLEDSEGAVPLPDHVCTIRMRVEPEVKQMWDALVRRCREEIRPDIPDGDVLMLLIADVWRTWDNTETRRQSRENPVLERDGWRCLVPGCRAMGTGKLQTHHVTFRSHGGTDDAWNEIAVCTAHHHHGIHEGIIRCSGRAPDDLTWEMGCAPGFEPFRVFHGQTHVGGAAAIQA